MPLDLTALLHTAQAQAKINSPRTAIKARIQQRESAEQKADEYARSLEKRNSLARALCSTDLDAMRFRFLADHMDKLHLIAGQSLAEMRQTIDGLVKREAIDRLAEMRRHHKELTGTSLPQLDWKQA